MLEDDDSGYPPLVSPRSPSYERAWHAFLQPGSADDSASIALLTRLYEAEQNASYACRKTAELMSHQVRFSNIVRDLADLHMARRSALGTLIEKLGGSPPRPEACRTILTEAYHSLAHPESASAGKDAFNLMRQELTAEYEAAIRSEHLDATRRAALRGLAPVATLSIEGDRTGAH